MPRAHLMSDHRRFTDGEAVIDVEGVTVGAVIATDAVAHFPVVRSVVPGTLEFIGTLTAEHQS